MINMVRISCKAAQVLNDADHCLYINSANLVLMDTVERLQSSKLWAEVPRGLFLIRGENVVLLGEIVGHIQLLYRIKKAQITRALRLQELDLEDRPLPWMREASVDEVLAAAKEEEEAKKTYQKRKEQVLHDKRGFSSEGAEYDAYT